MKMWRGHKVDYRIKRYGDKHRAEWLWMLKFNTSKLIFVEADTLLDAVKHCGYTQAHLRRSMPVQWLFKAEATKLRLAALHKEKIDDEKSGHLSIKRAPQPSSR